MFSFAVDASALTFFGWVGFEARVLRRADMVMAVLMGVDLMGFVEGEGCLVVSKMMRRKYLDTPSRK